MRIAALYDIHGNLPALEAVLAEVRRAEVEAVVVGGDVYPGPMSGEALACLLDLDIPARFIQGNGEREILALARGEETGRIPEPYRGAMRWEAERLDPKHRRAIESWPKTGRIDIPGLGPVLFCHATPRSDTEIFTRRTSEERLKGIFEGVGAALVVCGHTHMQFERMIGGVRVVNAGSVGMPFGRPGAYWLLLEPEVRLRRTEYDLSAAAARLRAGGHPRSEEFAAGNVLNPPSEEEMLNLYSRAG